MTSVFIDANIFFAAVRSSTGGSYFIIELAKQKKLPITTVAYALAEAERNISKKIGDDALRRHYDNLLTIKAKIQSLANIPLVWEYRLRQCVPEKDIPIVLGALMSNVPILLTLDQKHLIRNEKLATLGVPFLIMTPGTFLQEHF